MQRELVSNMVVDRSAQGDLLRINFNVSFPELSCEYATLDVSDTLGMVRGHKGNSGVRLECLLGAMVQPLCCASSVDVAACLPGAWGAEPDFPA